MSLKPTTATGSAKAPSTLSWAYNATGDPSTVTQGPTTFLFTGTRWGDPGRTIVNQCRLNGTASAHCNLTHIGSIWYISEPTWNGTFSTYSYNYTTGDRLGFAPCTVTRGVELMGPSTLTETTSSNRAAPGPPCAIGLRGDEVTGLLGVAALTGAFVFGFFLVL